MPRPSAGPRQSVHLRIPQEMYAELIMLRPELQDASGTTKYGAINNYFLRLIRDDLDRHTIWIKSQLSPQPGA
jgi:hypothetical protein